MRLDGVGQSPFSCGGDESIMLMESVVFATLDKCPD